MHSLILRAVKVERERERGTSFTPTQFTPRTFLIRNVIYKCFSSQIGGSTFFKGVAASRDLFLHHADRKRGGALSPKWLNNRGGGGVVKIFRSGRGGGGRNSLLIRQWITCNWLWTFSKDRIFDHGKLCLRGKGATGVDRKKYMDGIILILMQILMSDGWVFFFTLL